MKLNTHDAPHIRHPDSARSLMGDAAITMLFLYAMAYFYYGPRALTLAAASVAAAYVSDVVCTLIAGRRPNLRDLSPLVTGMLLPLMMPVSIGYVVVVAAAVFAVTVVKHPFGGAGHNVFNPAAAGYCFAAICFADQFFLYPMPLQPLPVFGSLAEVPLVNSPAFTLDLGGVPGYSLVEMALGNFPGPMGATNILVVLACLLYLVLRNTVRWEIPVFFFLSAAVTFFLVRLAGVGPVMPWREILAVVPYDMMSGVLMLGGAYLLGDPVTTPKRDSAKVAFALMAGIVAVLFRWFGGLEEEFPFAVLLMNATVWGFDMLGEQVSGIFRRRRKQA